MKVKLLKPKTIQGQTYPANCVIGVSQPQAEAWIADNSAVAVPDGTMARKAAYGVPGCMPPAEFPGTIKVDNTPKSSLIDALVSIEKQKTNTLKR